MYLGRKKITGKFTEKDVLEGELYKGQLKVLRFLSIAGIATPEILSIATGYTIKTLNRMYLYPLLKQFKLIKKVEFKDEVGGTIKTNYYTLTNRGYKKLARMTHKSLKELKFKIEDQVLSEHRKMIIEILAYAARFYGIDENITFRIGSEKQWRNRMKLVRDAEAEIIKKQYDIGSRILTVKLNELDDRMRKLPVPDMYVNENTHVLFIEVETGEDRRQNHIDEKLRRYEKYKTLLQEIMLTSGKEIYVGFVAKNEELKQSLKERLQKAKEKVSISFKILIFTKDELINLFQKKNDV